MSFSLTAQILSLRRCIHTHFKGIISPRNPHFTSTEPQRTNAQYNSANIWFTGNNSEEKKAGMWISLWPKYLVASCPRWQTCKKTSVCRPTVGALTRFVRSHLEDPQLSFYLCKSLKLGRSQRGHNHDVFGLQGQLGRSDHLLFKFKCSLSSLLVFQSSHLQRPFWMIPQLLSFR